MEAMTRKLAVVCAITAAVGLVGCSRVLACLDCDGWPQEGASVPLSPDVPETALDAGAARADAGDAALTGVNPLELCSGGQLQCAGDTLACVYGDVAIGFERCASEADCVAEPVARCVRRFCEPGATRCDGASRQVCGSPAWNDIEQCASAERCEASGCL